MRHPWKVSLAGAAVTLALAGGAYAVLEHGARPQRLVSSLGMRFEPNVGQADPRVAFVSRGAGYTMLMTRTGAVLKLARPGPHGATREAVVGMTYRGANAHPRLSVRGRQAGVSNYLGSRRSVT